jgi:hypothetical protein
MPSLQVVARAWEAVEGSRREETEKMGTRKLE